MTISSISLFDVYLSTLPYSFCVCVCVCVTCVCVCNFCICDCKYICVCVHVCIRTRERDRERKGWVDGQTDRWTDERERQREKISYNYTTLQVTFVD